MPKRKKYIQKKLVFFKKLLSIIIPYRFFFYLSEIRYHGPNSCSRLVARAMGTLGLTARRYARNREIFANFSAFKNPIRFL